MREKRLGPVKKQFVSGKNSGLRVFLRAELTGWAGLESDGETPALSCVTQSTL